LKYKFKNLKEKQTTLCVDEMSLKTSLHFDKKKDRIIGIEDLGKDKKKICGKASIDFDEVFMVVGSNPYLFTL
jgi:hypothetical protein